MREAEREAARRGDAAPAMPGVSARSSAVAVARSILPASGTTAARQRRSWWLIQSSRGGRVAT